MSPKFTGVLLALLFPSVSSAALVTRQMVVESALKHYPLITQAKEGLKVSEGEAMAADGAYDAVLKGQNLILPKGYYVRQNWDHWVEKRVGFANSRVFAGYTYGGKGVYPTDLSLTSTNSGGTPRVGVSFSALRNFKTDPDRAGRQIAKLGVSQSQNQVHSTEIEVKRESTNLYWSWIAALRNFQVYSDLLTVAEQRESVLKNRARAGDISEVIVMENAQYVARRKAELAAVELQLRQISLELSLYYRDEEGKPLEMSGEEERKVSDEIVSKELKTIMASLQESSTSPSLLDIAGRRPELLALGKELEKTNIELSLSKNSYLPLLDITAQYERYLGNEDPTNAPHVYTFLISLEIPLEYDLIRGQKSRANARKRMIASEFNFMKETIHTQVQKNLEGIRLSRKRMENASDEVTYATKLREVENYKFEKGGSNLFLINIREENMAQAKSNLIYSQLDFIRAHTDYQASTLNL